MMSDRCRGEMSNNTTLPSEHEASSNSNCKFWSTVTLHVKVFPRGVWGMGEVGAESGEAAVSEGERGLRDLRGGQSHLISPHCCSHTGEHKAHNPSWFQI